jgi:3-methyladenine DNA glycosylase/8-oxoguanine DNA glycosylase
VLGPLVASYPGLVVPGAWNPFEVGVWAILSGGRPGRDRLLEAFVARLGTPVPRPAGRPDPHVPRPGGGDPDNLAPIGLPEAEATAIAALAETLTSGAEASARSDQWRPWLALAAAHLMQTVLA